MIFKNLLENLIKHIPHTHTHTHTHMHVFKFMRKLYSRDCAFINMKRKYHCLTKAGVNSFSSKLNFATLKENGLYINGKISIL